MNSSVDPRRGDKINRYKPAGQQGASEDLVPDYMNILGNVIIQWKRTIFKLNDWDRADFIGRMIGMTNP